MYKNSISIFIILLFLGNGFILSMEQQLEKTSQIIKNIFSSNAIKKISREYHIDSEELKTSINYLNSTIQKEAIENLRRILEKYNLHVGCIMGMHLNFNLEILLKIPRIRKLYMIYPFNKSLKNAPKIFEIISKKIKKYLLEQNKSIDILASPHQKASELFKNNFVDFVYFGGNYNPEQIRKYISLWVPIINRGGIIILNKNKKDTKLNDEINKFCSENGLLNYKNESEFWCIRKPHKITFIIPCYNRAHTVKRAIDSIYQQNLDMPFEVVCTDDGSQDNTREILMEYQNDYSNFKALFHNENKGASAARNTAIINSDGNLLFNLDSDNILEPNSIVELVALLDSSGCDAATFWETRFFIDDISNRPSKESGFAREFRYECKNNIFDLWSFVGSRQTPLGGGNYLFTRKSYQIVGGYEGRIVETWIFGFRLIAKGGKIAILKNNNKNFYWHAISEDSKFLYYHNLNKNDEVRFKEVKKHPELFTKKAYEAIIGYNKELKYFLNDLRRGDFEFTSKKALKHLFASYWYEKNKMNEEARIVYKKALLTKK